MARALTSVDTLLMCAERRRPAVLLIRQLPTLPSGVAHIEELVDPTDDFLAELAGEGFDLDLPAGVSRPADR